MTKGFCLAVLMMAFLSLPAASNAALPPLNFGAHLTGDEEVPPRDTQAQGQVIFQLSADGTELDFRLIVANIRNVVAAHIHLAPPGVNGGIVVPLYGNDPPGGGRFSGVLATGTITASDLTGALAGGELSDLIEAFEDERAYVNVHTNDGVGGTNSGPGDFPGGEIRGQVR